MRIHAVLLLCLGARIGHAAAAPLPKAVQAALDAVAAVCSEAEGKPIRKDAVKMIQ